MQHRVALAIGAVSILLAVISCNLPTPAELPLPDVLSPPAPPELSLNVAPSLPSKGAEVSIHVRVHNAGDEGLQGYQLLVGYAMRDESSMIGIAELPITLGPGEVLE